MGRSDWTECKSKEQIEWVRREAEIGANYTIEPVGNEIPEEGTPHRLPFSTLALLEGGVRFPLHPLIVECLAKWEVFTTQCTVNVYRIIMGVVELNFKLDLHLGFSEIMYCYRLQFHKSRVYLQCRSNRNFLVTELPDSSAGKDHHYIYVGGDLFDPSLEYAARLPLKFGFKDKKKRKEPPLTKEQKREVHKAWGYRERSAAKLLGYKPLYNHNIAHHKEGLILSDTESKETEENENQLVRKRRKRHRSPIQQEQPSTSQTSDTLSPSNMVRTVIDLKSSSRRSGSKKSSSSSSHGKETEIPGSPRPSTPFNPSPQTFIPPPPPNPAPPSETSSLSNKRVGGILEKTGKQHKPEVIVAHEPRKAREQIMPFVPEVWNPRLQTGPNQPILKSDSAVNARVATGLAEVFFLPRDIEAVRRGTPAQVGEFAISFLGQSMQHIKVLMETVEGASSEARASRVQLEQSMNRSSELNSEVASLRASLRSSETERKDLLKDKHSLEETLAKKNAESAACIKIHLLNQQKLDRAEETIKRLEEQVKRLEMEKQEEYDLGVKEAVGQIEEQLPGIKEECRRAGWFLALEAAKIDSSVDVLKNGPPPEEMSEEEEPQVEGIENPSGKASADPPKDDSAGNAQPKEGQVVTEDKQTPPEAPDDNSLINLVDEIILDLSS